MKAVNQVVNLDGSMDQQSATYRNFWSDQANSILQQLEALGVNHTEYMDDVCQMV